MRIKYILILFLALPFVSFSQSDSIRLVQFSGTVLDGANDELMAIPFANVIVKNKYRGTYSDYNGFFSIVLEHGDTIMFTAVGYQNVAYVLPDSLTETRYSVVQLMTRDTINLPETIVYPWPSKEHFETEFLALNVANPLEVTAKDNLSEKKMKALRKTIMPDGNESADYFLRAQATKAVYYGQVPPTNIFSPLAWGNFIKAWKNGDFKKKKKKKTKRH